MRHRASLLTLLAWLVGCASPPEEKPMVAFEGQTMGTFYHVKVVGELTEEVQAQYRQTIESELERVNLRMSTYLEDSELMKLNRFSGSEPYEVSEDLFTVLEKALEVGERSGGAYDITIGPVVNLWGFGPEGLESEGVDVEEVEAMRQRVGFDKLHLGEDRRSVTKERGDLFGDLSSIAKGYAVDRVTEALAALGEKNLWVEVGGEVRAMGVNTLDVAWRVGIERPRLQPGTVQRLVSLENQAIATSGDYRNYREIDGQRYSHILDPRTGWPVRHHLASVSVVHPSCMDADAWATALLVLGAEEGLALAEEQGLAAYFLVRKGDQFVERATPAFRKLAKMR